MAFNPGVDTSDLDWLGIVLAVLASIVIGFIWYSPKMPTGRIWMKGIGMSMDHKPDQKAMMKGMVLMIVGAFLTMMVFMHVVLAFTESTWIETGDELTMGMAAQGAFWTWLGFFLPMSMSGVAWESRPWSHGIVVATYYLVNLMVAAMIFTWRLA
ncbi:MAG TPA: DUF1761 domain-containing protein [Candidatus Thermoplasmatota archaeon]|nr:DUF1761 domain-containing protein [Candidatus Thermoplasmatota archaeon]